MSVRKTAVLPIPLSEGERSTLGKLFKAEVVNVVHKDNPEMASSIIDVINSPRNRAGSKRKKPAIQK